MNSKLIITILLIPIQLTIAQKNFSVGETVIYGSILSNLDKNYVLLEEELGTESFLNKVSSFRDVFKFRKGFIL